MVIKTKALGLGLALLLSVGSLGCGVSRGEAGTGPTGEFEVPELGTVDPTTTTTADVTSTTVATTTTRPAEDPVLTRDDVDCDAAALGEDDEFQFSVAYYVVGGVLGERCYGDDDPTIRAAWDSLATITPWGQLNDLALFAGFSTNEDDPDAGTTLAFVNTIDDEGTAFQVSVNLAAYEDDPDEAALTMAHEFSHVFTALPSQIDRSPEAFDRCDTYFNGEGCYLPDSLMAEWITTFWNPDDLAKIDPESEVGIDDGEDLCAADPSFLGPYAATNPEEDFAESFAAFVYQVEAKTPEAQAKVDWFAQQPGLAEFRDRAIAAGKGPLEGSFDGCGS